MKATVVVLVACLLAGCGGKPEAAAVPKPEPVAPVSMSDLALPVTAPMQARERLLHDLGREQQKARGRSAAFDEAAGRDG